MLRIVRDECSYDSGRRLRCKQCKGFVCPSASPVAPKGRQGGGLGRSIPEGFTARQAKSAGSRANAAAEGAYLSYGRFRENLTRGRRPGVRGGLPRIAAGRRKDPRTKGRKVAPGSPKGKGRETRGRPGRRRRRGREFGGRPGSPKGKGARPWVLGSYRPWVEAAGRSGDGSRIAAGKYRLHHSGAFGMLVRHERLVRSKRRFPKTRRLPVCIAHPA